MAAGIPEELTSSYEQLLVLDVRRHLPGLPLSEPVGVRVQEMAHLLAIAGYLAMREPFEERNTAYEIATRIVMLDSDLNPGLTRGAEIVLARLGNFPGRDLLRRRFNGIPAREPLLQLEMRMHEIENTIADAGGQKRRLTDFQYEALQTFSAHRSVSVSAPTSAGKSFLLALEVLRKLRDHCPAGIVYVVPTRALVRQVVIDLRRVVADSALPFPLIRSVARTVTREEAPNGIVHVLTQERLLSLLNSEEGAPWITDLIVDEAQEIGSGARGILLHTAIERVRLKFPKAEIIFASPQAKNPEYLLELFSCADAMPHYERHSPVSRNLVLVDSIKNHARQVACSLLTDSERVPLGERELPFNFHGLSSLRRLAFFARSLGNDDDPENCCIIYANGARDAERIAHHLTRGFHPLEPTNADVEELIAYLNEHVHPSYGLADVLRYGVAFHYSNMPGAVRAAVEDLFQRRKLRFLCCTSTLLQGVNLPARHIVMEGPRRGKDTPMSRPEFLNLAGRAGRLNHEFHGNVWCLRPDRWEIPCYTGEPLQEIRSSFDRILEDGGSAIRVVLDDDSQLDDAEAAVAALGRIFTEYVQQDRSLRNSRYSTVDNAESLHTTLVLLEELRREAQLPPEIFTRNSGIHPQRLESLYLHLHSLEELDDLCPIRPNTRGTNPRLREIFQLVQRYLGGVENDSYRQHAKIASAWIHENPLNRIIANEVAYRQAQARQSSPPVVVNIRDIIYSIIDTIERDLRFRYVKYLRAYYDVLAHILRNRGDQEAAEHLVPFHLYLEHGAFRPVSLSLISLGLTRVTSLLLAKHIVLASDTSPEECLRRCRQAIMNAPGLQLPVTVRREIEALVGG